jgi:hypothetical protein
VPPRKAGRVIMNKKKPKKTIFGSCKPQHISLEHNWEAYSLTACSTNASTIFAFIYNNNNNNNNNKRKSMN